MYKCSNFTKLLKIVINFNLMYYIICIGQIHNIWYQSQPAHLKLKSQKGLQAMKKKNFKKKSFEKCLNQSETHRRQRAFDVLIRSITLLQTEKFTTSRYETQRRCYEIHSRAKTGGIQCMVNIYLPRINQHGSPRGQWSSGYHWFIAIHEEGYVYSPQFQLSKYALNV